MAVVEITTTEHSLRAARDEACKQHDRFLLDLLAIGLYFRLDHRVRRPTIEPADE